MAGAAPRSGAIVQSLPLGVQRCPAPRQAGFRYPHRCRGVLPKGTPVAQCLPVKRESWVAHTAPFTAEETQRVQKLTKAINHEPGLYRRKFRA